MRVWGSPRTRDERFPSIDSSLRLCGPNEARQMEAGELYIFHRKVDSTHAGENRVAALAPKYDENLLGPVQTTNPPGKRITGRTVYFRPVLSASRFPSQPAC